MFCITFDKKHKMRLTKIDPVKIKVGDVVEDFILGKGVIRKIDLSEYYSLSVEFENISQWQTYSIEGLLEVDNKRPSVYQIIEDDETN